TARCREVRRILRQFPEIAVLVPAIGRPDDGTDPTGYYNVETNCPLRRFEDWPNHPTLGRPRTKEELVKAIQEELEKNFRGVDWDISQIIRDNVMEALSGVKGENSIKVFGPDLGTLEDLAGKIKDVLNTVPGVDNAGVFRIQGQSNLEFPVDREKCARWNVSAADVQSVIQCAVGGKAVTQMQEGGKSFDVTVRWPPDLRADEQSILKIPVAVSNVVTGGGAPSSSDTPVSGSATGVSPTGSGNPLPSPTGSASSMAPSFGPPARPLREFVTPNGRSFLRPGASTIYREQGQRLIAIKFEVR